MLGKIMTIITIMASITRGGYSGVTMCGNEIKVYPSVENTRTVIETLGTKNIEDCENWYGGDWKGACVMFQSDGDGALKYVINRTFHK